jgi:hypothetical protein
VKTDEQVATETADRRRRLGELDDAIGELAGNIAAAHARLLTHLAEFDTACGWSDQGALSMAGWLSWRCGIAPGAAREQLKVAHRLGELHDIRAAFEAGELSYWQVRTLCRVAMPHTEALLLRIARESTAAQLMRIVAKFKWAIDQAELRRANDRHRRRSVFYFFDDDGFFHITAKLCPEDGAVVVSALEAAAKQVRAEVEGCAHGSDCDDGFEQTMSDALVRVAEDSLGAAGGSAEPYRAVVHVDVASLVESSGDRCELDHGPALATETARRICCDARIDTVLAKDGDVLDVGRSSRTPPPRLRRALEIRDETCRWPGCTARRHLQSHHVVHWLHGGPTAPANLTLVCRRHHRLVHEGGFGLEVDVDGTRRFYRPDGSEIAACGTGLSGSDDRLVAANRDNGIAITAETCKSRWDGWHIDTTYVADVLCLEAVKHDPG